MYFDCYDDKQVSELLGQTLTSLEKIDYNDNDALLFNTDAGEQFIMTHRQNCCERVVLDDIIGDLSDLIGSPLLISEEVNDTMKGLIDPGPKNQFTESYTWTFYKFATIKGYVDLRWYGSSNGYYSESVSFFKVTKE